MESSRTELAEQLRQLGVDTVTARYDGSGDDGQLEAPEFGAGEVPANLRGAVEDLFYELLEAHYSGWEDDEGSCGELVWDVRGDRVKVVHNTRFASYETEEQTL